MDFQTGCDLLALNAETVVRQHAANIEAERREGQPFSAWYLEHRVAAQGFNKQAAAEHLGMSRTFFYNLINGNKKLSDEMVHTFAGSMDFTVAELLVARSLDVMDEVDHG